MASHKRQRSENRRTAAALLVFGLACLFSLFGWTFGWYGSTVVWYDDVAHGVVPFGMGTLIAVLLDRRLDYVLRGHRVLGVLLSTCAALSIALVWEFAEWIYDLRVAGNVILGKRDTMLDLAFGTLGAFVGSLVGMGLMSTGRAKAYETQAASA